MTENSTFMPLNVTSEKQYKFYLTMQKSLDSNRK